MYRIRIKFKKQGALRFLSHLELISCFERAVRRANLPYLLTQGFNPRIKISWGPPTSVGMESEAEYFDLFLATRVPQAQVVERLNAVLPQELSVLQARYVSLSLPSLMSTISVTVCRVVVRIKSRLDKSQVELAAKRFLARGELDIKRKDKQRTVDLKQALIKLTTKLRSDLLELALVLSMKGGNNLKPEEVMAALASSFEKPLAYEMIKVERKGLYLKLGDRFLDPLNADEGGEKQAS